ncbi:MAG: glycoside hydrolase family 2 TIM barrel-domain containing protein [Oscillospiraceae bacterium]
MFDLNWLQNPKIFAVNRLAAHSSHNYFRQDGTSFTKSLNGEWLFCYAKTLQEIPANAENTDIDDTAWDKINVPCAIQMQGGGKYGTPHYVNTMYPWDGHEAIVPGEIPQYYNPVGIYRKHFNVDDTNNEKTFIRFDGVDSAIALWCNGEFVGYAEDSFTRSEFDLSKFVRAGDNVLCAKVFRFCSGSWLEDQDFWRFSGIFRDVTLFTIPKTHAWDIYLKPCLSDDFTVGVLEAEIKLEGSGFVELELCDNTVKADIDNSQITLKLAIDNPKLWSAESPYLYNAVLKVYDENHNLCEICSIKAGFRKFGIKDGIMCINGKRIVFKGVNRHEWNCNTGRTLTHDDMLWDVKNMKRNNINAVRTSHYPNDIHFYDLCDEYGIYVIDEANLETHGTWQKQGGVNIDEYTLPNDNPDWRDIVLDRAVNMLERDKNHPSILIWSCGNESCGGENIYLMSEYFRKRDNSRLVHYEGVCHDRRYNATSDIESMMYMPVSEIKKYLAEHKDKPFISCEYSHAMANSCGGLFKYTALPNEEPLYQGGFIWDYIDQGIAAIAPDGKEYFAYGGDYGDAPTDYNFCLNGLVYSNRINSPKMQEVKACYQNIDIEINETEVRITNNFLFNNLNDYALNLVYSRNGEKLEEKDMPLSAEPFETQIISICFNKPSQSGIYVIHAKIILQKDTSWAENGYIIAEGERVIKHINESKIKCELPITVTRGDLTVGVRGDDFEVLFSKGAGGLVSYRKNGKALLGAILPRLNFWRASTDNDKGNNFARENVKWLAAGQFTIVETLNVESTKTQATITLIYHLPIEEKRVQVQYQVEGDGTVNVNMKWLNESTVLPEFGMLFCMPKEYNNVKYFGRGAFENYIDRKKGAFLGEYSYNVNDNISDYAVPQECGNRTETYSALIQNASENGLLFTADAMEFSALPFTPQEMEQARHCYDLPAKVKTVIRCNLQQTGVGGDDSWGAKTHSEFITTIKKNTSFCFSFKGI